MKYSIVTGGTKGIGKEICRELLMQGFTVIAVYKDDDVAALSVKEEFGSDFQNLFFTIKCDLSDPKKIPALFAEVSLITKSIDVLILNAGKTVRKGIDDITIEEWESVVNVNLTTPLFLIQSFLPFMTNGSNIIFTGSLMAEFPHSVSPFYGVTKSAVHAMVKNLVKFLAPKGIRVNGVAPGFVDTEWQKEKPAEVKENICKKVSLKRFAEPGEIASAYLFIINNQYLNGEIITIDGGYCYQ
jgi:3-oxoacyl-[acyl-carrier protein] reductase